MFEHQEKMVTSNYDAFLDNNMCKNSNFVIGIFKYRIRQGPVLPYYQHILDLLWNEVSRAYLANTYLTFEDMGKQIVLFQIPLTSRQLWMDSVPFKISLNPKFTHINYLNLFRVFPKVLRSKRFIIFSEPRCLFDIFCIK